MCQGLGTGQLRLVRRGDHEVERLPLLVMRRAFMIYTVELNFSDPTREEEWNAWYAAQVDTG